MQGCLKTDGAVHLSILLTRLLPSSRHGLMTCPQLRHDSETRPSLTASDDSVVQKRFRIHHRIFQLFRYLQASTSDSTGLKNRLMRSRLLDQTIAKFTSLAPLLETDWQHPLTLDTMRSLKDWSIQLGHDDGCVSIAAEENSTRLHALQLLQVLKTVRYDPQTKCIDHHALWLSVQEVSCPNVSIYQTESSTLLSNSLQTLCSK